MRNLPRLSGEYLSALHNIHSLELINIEIEHISKQEFHTCFSAFRETLTHLTLDIFSTSFSAFVTLVDYFPNITTLRLGSFAVEPDKVPVPQLSRPLRGRICIFHPRGILFGGADFLDRLAVLDLEYEELALEPHPIVDTRLLGSILQLGASTVKYLRLTTEFQGGNSYHTPSSPQILTQPLMF